MKNILVFIGARGGSKGIRGKNIRSLMGKPLIQYTIDQALKWGRAKRIIVSTDSKEIADVAKKGGAEVPFLRPAELASDNSSKGLAIRHGLMECEKIYNEEYDILVDLDVTAPVRTTEDLDNCLDQFNKLQPKTLFSVVHAHKNPYFNMVEEQKNGNIALSKGAELNIVRRQDAPIVYAMNASIYFYRREYLLEKQDPSPMSDETKVYVMDDLSGIDIDREIDFQYIEFLLREGIVKL